MNDEQRKWIYWAIPIAIVIAAAAALYYGRTRQAEPQPQVAETSEPTPAVEQPVQHPLETEAPAEPLPSLSESDPLVQQSLLDSFGRSLEQFLIPKDIVRNTVATIDNLPRKKLPVQRLPVQPTPGELVVNNDGDVTLSAANYARYEPAVKLLQSVDAAQAAQLYRRFYPLFQQAYADLGYPDGYFNDRLVEVIDHLLAAPEIEGPIRLTQPSVFYEFADPSLEERSAGQKLLVRIGPKNAAIVKAKLRELRAAITAGEQSFEPQTPENEQD
ncbi:MAG: DUF3014 domain-containing protein [Steroidobacteraceae bacterium]|jgi:hypothetical protein|nr:DUF3014 domain-containing protein [Steroidobacteraceae bacterium]